MFEAQLMNDAILKVGRQLLNTMSVEADALRHRHTMLRGYALTDRPHEAASWLACVLALESVIEGNFGVGAVLLDEAGVVVESGHNEVFHPYFRSDRHAEMVVLERWEESRRAAGKLTLVTSLEPCPMCLVRLSCSHVLDIFHVAVDEIGGMVSRLQTLPPYWLSIAEGKNFAFADCSDALRTASLEIVRLNLDLLTGEVTARR